MRSMDLGVIEDEPFNVEVGRFLTSRTAVVGMSGSGKSHLIGVICEELCSLGASFVIIDPEGEYASLKEKFQVVWASREPGADIPLTREGTKKIARTVVDQSARLIMDTSESKDSAEEMAVVSEFLKHFYSMETKAKTPILVIVEEADRFASQVGGEKVDELLEISRRGRKRGIGLLIATQRPQMVDKNVLSQCGNQLIGKLRTKNDLKAVDLFFSDPKKVKSLPRLQLGQFHAMGEFNPDGGLLKVKGRVTTNLGGTPTSKGGNEFSVEDFLSDLTGEQIRTSTEGAPSEVKKTKVKGKKKGKKGPKVSEVLEDKEELDGIRFKISMEKAARIADDRIDRTLLTKKPKESMEETKGVYWPLFRCSLVRSRRGLLGIKNKEYTMVFDPIMLRILEFKDGYELKQITDMEDRLADLRGSKKVDVSVSLRILRALQRSDQTPDEIVSKTGIPNKEVKQAVKYLGKKKMITVSERVGRTAMYRPLVPLKGPSLRELDTEVPKMKNTVVQKPHTVLEPVVGVDFVEQVVKGLFDETELLEANTFYMPFFISVLIHKKKGTRKAVVINGRTGTVIELGQKEAKPII